MVIYENLTLTCQPKVDFILFIGVCVQEPCFCSLSVRVPIFKLFVYGECDYFFLGGGGGRVHLFLASLSLNNVL